ncbi:50S ribosomal protein L2 [Candidatus Micrarchaeota archaeon]|nr:50S ribosomal protein L2 [Candidatus Micrarchaeota archaeon]
MGKLLIQQRRGKGSRAYKRPSHRFKTDLALRKYDEIEKNSKLRGQVIEFVDDPARDAILMNVKFENGESCLFIAPEGIGIGDVVELGTEARIGIGNVLPLTKIPEGTPIYNLETVTGDRGKLIHSAGTCGFIVSRETNHVLVKLPSKHIKSFDATCRAQIGVISGGGKLENPFLKAGTRFHAMKAKNKTWPNVRGVAMNAVSHPFGGKEHHRGRSSCVGRNTPPGRKVGHLAARSTGRRKGKLSQVTNNG